ncbi:DUF4434 domain-containing protein [Nonomuraea zeae]|uniref:F5/8 type C domain-containing protein n=1 Tax=Nonomuraea zeae TaxID=1642303 RepID=A0A5S4G101_9ACTN|nr:DUF4434 domain-containing protein [Nonomuraea zeae]TMR26717.1 hypothetical protein ETD85_41585 [Nonomuraea zeae]
MVGAALSAADRAGMTVYLGLQVNDIWNFTTTASQSPMAAFYKKVADHLHALTPGKPVVVSPFFNTAGGLTTAQWQSMWTTILTTSPIDVIALQDGVGAGHATALWADTETFNLDFQPMGTKGIVADMVAVQPYVSSYWSFSYDHYQSPLQVAAIHDQTYRDYLATGAVESTAPTAPAGLTATAFTDAGLDPSTAYAYTVRAFDAAGNQSAASGSASATTPAAPNNPVNLAAGRSYTVSLAASSSYPDSGGELTNGTYGTPSYGDAAWQGRNTGSPYSITVDLGSQKLIKEPRSDWLQTRSVYIFLPKKVTYEVSANGSSFTTAGSVAAPAVGDADQSRGYRLLGLNTTARYVRITVEPAGSAPPHRLRPKGATGTLRQAAPAGWTGGPGARRAGTGRSGRPRAAGRAGGRRPGRTSAREESGRPGPGGWWRSGRPSTRGDGRPRARL